MPRSDARALRVDALPPGYGEEGATRTPWLAERQAQARAAFERLEMPTWRRGRGWSLRPEPLALEAYRPRPRAEAATVAGDEQAITFVDGRLLALPRGVGTGVEVIPLGPGAPEILPAAAADWIGSLVPPAAGKLEALNLLAMTGGVLVRVAKGAHPLAAIRIRHRLERDAVAALARIVVVVEEGAEAEVVEECLDGVGNTARTLVDGVTEIYVGAGARLRYVDVTELGPEAKGIVRRRARLDRDSHLEWTSGVFGGGFLSLAWDTVLAGSGARVDATGVYVSKGREQHALVSDTWHRVASTEADVQFRGAVFDRCGSVFDGIIRTDSAAKGTVSHLGDHLLFLSPHAHADSIPALLIEGDDVKVGHGATIGRVDPDQLYYLGARGIDPVTAREMLVLGYFEPTLARIPDEALRESQRSAIRRLARAGREGGDGA